MEFNFLKYTVSVALKSNKANECESQSVIVSPKYIFKTDDRVVVNEKSGFHKGAKGIVMFVEPRAKFSNDGKIWVLRDGSAGPVWFFADEINPQ